MHFPRFLSIAAVILLWVSVAFGGVLVLKDGTRVEGEIRRIGTSYSVRLPDGTLKMFPEASVATVDGKPVGAAAATPATPGTPGNASPAPAGSASFAAVKREADAINSNPSLGVMLWKKYLQSNPTGEDKANAEKELAYWEQLVEGKAEKIRGKWVGGAELEALRKQVDELFEKAFEPGTRELSGVHGIKNLEQILRIYPDSFDAHFELGFHYLVQAGQLIGSRQNIDRSIRSLESASRLRPDVPETFSNLAIAYNFRDRYVDSVEAAWKAVQMSDEKDLVQNLANALSHAPPGMRMNNARVRKIVEQSLPIFRKHNISGGADKWLYLRPDPRGGGGSDGGSPGDDDDKGPPGIFGNGTGFLISADGYIMTNEHVARPGDYLLVRLHNGDEFLAQRVVIDDEQDIAILRIKAPNPLPYIKIAAYDAPTVGADVTVLGFPLLSQFGLRSSVKITRGIVTAFDRDQPKVDVTVDAQVNPGNSGGPMVDRFGNLLALVAMKTLAIDASVSSYGLGLSPGRLRKFFEKHEGKFPGLKLEFATGEGAGMTTEQIVEKVAPATVVILMGRGEVPPSLRAEAGEDAKPEDAPPSSPPADEPRPDASPDEPRSRKGGGMGQGAGPN
jgi:hypothetical protein